MIKWLSQKWLIVLADFALKKKLHSIELNQECWLDLIPKPFPPLHIAASEARNCVEKAVGVERIDKASTMYTLLPVYILLLCELCSYTEADSVVGAFVSRFEAAIAIAGKPRHDWTRRRQAQWRWWRRWRTVGPYCKKTAKNQIQKIREIDESYLCLQRFDKFWMLSAGNRKLCEFAETCMDFTREITLGELISTFGTTVRRGAQAWHY